MNIRDIKEYNWPNEVYGAGLVKAPEGVYLALQDEKGCWFYCSDFWAAEDYPLNEGGIFLIWKREK